MSQTPENVLDFENRLQQQVKAKAQADYDEVLELKLSLDNTVEKKVNTWESGYYKTKLLQSKYQVNPLEIRNYFEVSAVLKGMFSICQTLFGVEIEEVEQPNVWHKDVRLIELKEGNQLIGRCYLDLYPRKNKYGHAACFPMIQRTDHQIPTIALVCNFPKPTKEVPSLLQHGEVTTFFHEFGHGLHCLLSKSPIYSFSGTNVKHDFVEVPSQLFENWCWNYKALSLFAKHYKTGEQLPKVLFDKMLAAKNVGSGLHILQQILYGMYDMTLHNGYQADKDGDTTTIFKSLQEKITLYPYFENTHFEAAFGHLMGYAAGYYGYLWSLVYAEDMFSMFKQNGILDKETGRKYRQEVLAKGGTVEEIEQVKNFLGREPQQDAFLKSIGLN